MDVEMIASQSSKENSLWEFQLQLQSYHWQVSINRQEAALRPKSRGHATWLCFQKLKIKFHCNHLILNSSEPHGVKQRQGRDVRPGHRNQRLLRGNRGRGGKSRMKGAPFVSLTPLLSPTHRHTLHPPRHTLQVQPHTLFFPWAATSMLRASGSSQDVPSTYTSNPGAVLSEGIGPRTTCMGLLKIQNPRPHTRPIESEFQESVESLHL